MHNYCQEAKFGGLGCYITIGTVAIIITSVNILPGLLHLKFMFSLHSLLEREEGNSISLSLLCHINCNFPILLMFCFQVLVLVLVLGLWRFSRMSSLRSTVSPQPCSPLQMMMSSLHPITGQLLTGTVHFCIPDSRETLAIGFY